MVRALPPPRAAAGRWPDLGRSPRAAVADTGPLKRAPPWWGTAEHSRGPTLNPGLDLAVKHQDAALPLVYPRTTASGFSFPTAPWDQMVFE